jgi:cyclic-di-GMP phosphodiesterase, flagellum assembly factor TipF
MQDGITMSPRQGATSGGLAMLDVIVLIAMAITAAAFAAGLTLQAGLPLWPVLIATAALFLAMAASFFMLGRGRRSGGGGERLDELEEALEIIDGDLQRIDRVEDDVARLDLLSDRVERLDQALGGFSPTEIPGGKARVEELATEFENVYARIEALRADVAAENRSQRDQIAGDLGALEGLIKSLSGDMDQETSVVTTTRSLPPIVEVEEIEVEIEEATETLAGLDDETEAEIEPEPEIDEDSEPLAAALFEAEPETDTEPLIVAEVEDEIESEAEAETEAPLVVDEIEAVEEEIIEEEIVEDETEADEPTVAAFLDDDDAADNEMRDAVRQAVETGRVELYLQPAVTLPDRKVCYFESFTRVRTTDDNLILPSDYVPVAKRAGMMPLIDNVLLVRSVQVLRRLGPDTRVRGVFCNVSMHSLLDPDYFPELVEFMEENNGLSENLIFEISQPEILGLTEGELSCLDTLGALGYNFSLDNVADLDGNFASLSDRYFRYVKISAAQFLSSPGRTASDLKRDLDGLGMQLIIDKVEEEGDVAELLDHGIEIAQGYLFGEPKPMNAALSRELEDAGAV